MVGVSFLGYKDFNGFIEMINESEADFIHVDVKDNKFVSGRHDPFLKLYKAYLNKPLDVHLMCARPHKYIRKYAFLPARYITIHVEIDNPLEELNYIEEFGIKKGLAIKPSSDLDLLTPFLDKIDYILLMSVEPGLSGQSFMEETYDRLRCLKQMIKGRDIVIAIDGGINNTNASKLRELGADILVSSSYVLNGDFNERVGLLK